ncbi:MAG: hypothetical protein JNJ83_22950 [Verrucomicrobiaceae bacterium]|nr:hypothetical protein [Verrucomicrobiaceae bacterium]
MIVVSDNSALSALAEIGLLDLLPRLFGQVVIPEAVRSESGHAGAPQRLRDWIAAPPEWLHIVPDPDHNLLETLCLGPGEAAAITLAWENRRDSLLILDEKRGRQVAEALGLQKTGLLGIIAEAAERRWLDFDETLGRLVQTGFHIREPLIEAVRKRLHP